MTFLLITWIMVYSPAFPRGAIFLEIIKSGVQIFEFLLMLAAVENFSGCAVVCPGSS